MSRGNDDTENETPLGEATADAARFSRPQESASQPRLMNNHEVKPFVILAAIPWFLIFLVWLPFSHFQNSTAEKLNVAKVLITAPFLVANNTQTTFVVFVLFALVVLFFLGGAIIGRSAVLLLVAVFLYGCITIFSLFCLVVFSIGAMGT